MSKKLKGLIASGLAVLNIGTIFGPTVGAIPEGEGDSTSQEGVKPLDPAHLRFVDPADTRRVEEIRKAVEKMDSILSEIKACKEESDARTLELYNLERLYLEKRKECEQIKNKLIKFDKDYESAKEEYMVVNGQKEHEERERAAKREQEERERAAEERRVIAQFKNFLMRINSLIGEHAFDLTPNEVFESSYPYVDDESMKHSGGIPGLSPKLGDICTLTNGMQLLAEARTYGDLHKAICLYLKAAPVTYNRYADYMYTHPFFYPNCSYLVKNVSVPSVFISEVLELRKSNNNLNNEELVKAAKEIVIVNAMIWLNSLSKRLFMACREHNPDSDKRVKVDGSRIGPYVEGDTATIGVMKLLPLVYFQNGYLADAPRKNQVLWKDTTKYFNVKEQMDNTKRFVRQINKIRKKSDDFTPEIQDLYGRFVCLAKGIDKELQAAIL